MGAPFSALGAQAQVEPEGVDPSAPAVAQFAAMPASSRTTCHPEGSLLLRRPSRAGTPIVGPCRLRRRSLVWFGAVSAAACLGWTGSARAQVATGQTIFQFGTEDGAYAEFSNHDLSGAPFTCRAGVDCSAARFPFVLTLSPGASEFPGQEATRATIDFELAKSYRDLDFHMARAGVETVDVTVDGRRSYSIPASIFGSGESFTVSSYDLYLGPLGPGRHRISLSVVDDGAGDGWFGWDALGLHGF